MFERKTLKDFALSIFDGRLFKQAGSSESSKGGPAFYTLREKAQEGKEGKLGYRYYWDDGFRIDSPQKKARIKMNLLLNLDAGNNACKSTGGFSKKIVKFHRDSNQPAL